MGISRRRFVTGSTALLGSSLILPRISLGQSDEVEDLEFDPLAVAYPILQTGTNESTAQFKILVGSREPLAYQIVFPTGRKVVVSPSDRYVHPSWTNFAVDHLLVTGLRPNTDYKLQVIDAGSGTVRDERVFSALDRSKRRGKVAYISCMNDDFADVQKKMWRVVANQNPDVVFLIGDAVYLDGRNSSDERGLWRRHLEVRRALELFRWKRLRPVISIWDDHDYGTNDGGAEFPLKFAVRTMFEAMFGSMPIAGLEKGPSLALEANFFGQSYFLMDDRFFRGKGWRGGSHWGDEQEGWFFERLKRRNQPAFIMNGSQFFGAYHGWESFEREHPTQFNRVLTELSRETNPVVFVSGDRHFSEVMKIEKSKLGYETLEITSSSLHSNDSFGLEGYNPRRILFSNRYNFVLVESSATSGGMNLSLRGVGPGGATLFRRTQTITRG